MLSVPGFQSSGLCQEIINIPCIPDLPGSREVSCAMIYVFMAVRRGMAEYGFMVLFYSVCRCLFPLFYFSQLQRNIV